MIPDFNEILAALRTALEDLVEAQWQQVKAAALKDGKAFLEQTRADLERWTQLLAAGSLTPEEFAFLVQAKKDLAALEALKQRGLAKARLTRFRNALLDTLVNTVVGLVV
jgi:hypothetical protein